MKNIFKQIWYSDKFIPEDKRIINGLLKYGLADHYCRILVKYYANKNNHYYPFVNDIIKKYGNFFNIEKKNDNCNVRLSYYGYKHIQKGGYCIGYYINKILSFKFLFKKTFHYVGI